MKKQILVIVLLLPVMFASCIKEPEPHENTKEGNFEALWEIIDARYCYLDYKNINWDSVYTVYKVKLANIEDDPIALFDLFAEMLAVLKDGHVNLYSDFDISRYDKWYTDSAANYNSSVISKRYLDEKRRIAGGLRYAKLKDHNIGYVYYGSFSDGFSDVNMLNVFEAFENCDGLILDVRDNGGGSLAYAEQLASYFFTEDKVTGYIRYKTGAGHSEFSEPTKIPTKAHAALKWQKPVAVLTNRYSYSATNDFVNRMLHAPNAFTVGSWTGGGGGMPLSSELPNGWMIRFSACPMYTVDMENTENGIAPDYYAAISPENETNGVDAIIERAVQLINYY